MKQFNYTIRAPRGIHALTAQLLAKQANEYPDTAVTITKGNRTVSVGQLLKLIALKIKEGDAITLCCDGPNEENAFEIMGYYLCDNL